jgi:hypothetical protein
MEFIDLAILGCSRLEISFFLLRAGVRRSWFLLLDFPALLAVEMQTCLCQSSTQFNPPSNQPSITRTGYGLIVRPQQQLASN